MRALCLSGGAAKGAWEAGVCKRLIGDRRRTYKIFTGVSVGTINALRLTEGRGEAQVGKCAQLIRDWHEITTDHVYVSKSTGYAAAVLTGSLFDMSPLRRFLEARVNSDAIARSGNKLLIGAVNMSTKKLEVAREYTPNLIDWAMASSAIPVIFPLVKIGSDWYGDGGVRDVTLIAQAIMLGATEVDIVLAQRLDADDEPWRPESPRAVPDILMRLIDTFLTEITEGDLRAVGLRTQVAQLADRFAHVKLNLYTPSTDLGDSMSFDPAHVRGMIKRGYIDAIKQES